MTSIQGEEEANRQESNIPEVPWLGGKYWQEQRLTMILLLLNMGINGMKLQVLTISSENFMTFLKFKVFRIRNYTYL